MEKEEIRNLAMDFGAHYLANGGGLRSLPSYSYTCQISVAIHLVCMREASTSEWQGCRWERVCPGFVGMQKLCTSKDASAMYTAFQRVSRRHLPYVFLLSSESSMLL